MSLLDELQSEVRKIKAQEAKQTVELAAQEDFYRVQLRPVMLYSYEYFAEIVENLNIVAPEIKPRYPLNPLLEKGLSLNQSRYKFRSDHKDNPHQIDIFCRCTLENPHEFYLPSLQAVQNHAALLDSYNFTYHRKNRLDSHHNIRGATFILEGPMIAHIRIAASPADRSIHVLIRNIEDRPVNRYKFSPEEVSDDLLERLAKLLIRQLPALVDRKVDESLRHRLRRQLERDKNEAARDIAKAQSEREADMLAEKNTRLIQRTKNSVAERARNLLKYFSPSGRGDL